MTTTQRIRFDPLGTGFHAEVKRRVDAFFEDGAAARTADSAMVGKTVFWFVALAALYGLLLGDVLPGPLGWVACAAFGFTFAVVGFNVGHDALHGAYSRRAWLNRVLGWTFQGFGTASYTWTIAHNVVHHTWTNIPGHDTDLDPGLWMRFHASAPHGSAHRFQHLYAWGLYCFTTLVWVFQKDFVQVLSKDPRTGRRAPLLGVASVLVSKLSHAVFFIGLPILVVDRPLWQIAIGYLLMHFAAGLTLAVVFQLAHVVEGTLAPDGPAGDAWADHQMRTTSNFGRGSFLCQFVCGGLNHQVEHHLFPRICHVHYPAIAPIVERTAREFGLPYLEHATFVGALASHARTLRALGRAPSTAT